MLGTLERLEANAIGGDYKAIVCVLLEGGADAWHDRLVPTTAMESYLETIMRWFGADDHALDEIFPNRHKFQRVNIDFL